MPVTFAHWGHYTPCFKNLFENLGYEVIAPEKTTQKDIRRGTKLSPELYCFPLKVNVGNYLNALEKGADTIFMWESIHGNCRFRYYWIVQQKVLREAGYDVKVVNLNAKNFFSKMRRIRKENNLSWKELVHAVTLCLQQIRFVEKLEERTAYFRPREKREGETDQLFEEIFEEMPKTKSFKALRELKRKAKNGFNQIELERDKEILKTKVIGEIYTVVDNAINFDLEKKLGKMGVEVDRDMSVSYFVKHGVFPWIDYFMQKKVDPYLKSTVGGHGRDAISEMIDSIKEDMDGVVHLLPFGCMPEVTVRPILQDLHQKSGLPFLSLSLDEEVGEAGIQTRLEAFVDVLKNYHQNK